MFFSVLRGRISLASLAYLISNILRSSLIDLLSRLRLHIYTHRIIAKEIAGRTSITPQSTGGQRPTARHHGFG